MTPEAARATVQMRQAVAALELTIENLNQLRLAGEEMPDVTIEIQRLQQALLGLHYLQMKQHVKAD